MSDRIQTTVVGSYPVPAWLRAFPSRSALIDAMMVVLKVQELAGLDRVADGELSRFDVNHPETNGMIDYFIRPLGGVETRLSREQLEAFRGTGGMAFRAQPAGVVTGPIDEGSLNLPADYALARPLTKLPLTFTLTSPYMLAKTLLDEHYRDRRALTMAVADALAKQVAAIDAEVIQVDEANLPGSPEDGPWVADAINRVLDAVRGRRAVHVCFGNYGGQTIQQGTWEALIDFINRLHVDHLVLEFARRGYAELPVLKDVRDDIQLGIGVIDIKDNEVETPDIVASRIEAACDVVGEKRIAYVHPDCGFWMLPRSVADAKMRTLVQGKDLFYAA
jgi:5-methyltetrahydropteroyltriglutamate--homocysteine methyltransferase